MLTKFNQATDDHQSLLGYPRHFEERYCNPERWSWRVPNPRLERPHQQVAEGEEALGEQAEGVGGQELLIKGSKNAGQVKGVLL